MRRECLAVLVFLGFLAPAAGEPPKVGYVTEVSGPFASPWVAATRETIDRLKVPIFPEDARHDPAQAVNVARKLVERDGARIVIVGVESAGVALAAAESASEAGAVVVSATPLPVAVLARLRAKSRDRVFAIADLPPAQAEIPARTVAALRSKPPRIIALGATDLLTMVKLETLGPAATPPRTISLDVWASERANLEPASMVLVVTRSAAAAAQLLRDVPHLREAKVTGLMLAAPAPMSRLREVERVVRRGLAPPSDVSVDAIRDRIAGDPRVDKVTGAIALPWDTAAWGLEAAAQITDEMFAKSEEPLMGGGNKKQCCECKSTSNHCCTCDAKATCKSSGEDKACKSVCG